MAGDIKTGSSLCESCALFGADYSNEYNNWITSRKQYESVFYIPYHRSDVYPGFPSLTRSGDAGCELCAYLKHRVQSKHYRPKKKSALYRFWKEDKVKLTGGFLQDHSVVAKNATVPATSLFIKVIYTKRLLGKFRGHYTHIIKMDALRTNQGSAIVYPLVLPFAAETTLCPQNISLIHRWLNDCEVNHPSCKKGDVRNFLPTRLICVKSDSARLVETRQFSDSERQLAHYLALSHCWGPKTEFQYKTTSQNLSSRLQSMVFANFPQNIKDAISVCRALGVKYLWIDSICIIQNLPHDLAREMEVMLEVYANAHVTISATCAASADKGFLSRTPKPGPKLNIPRQGGSKINGKDDSIVIFTEGRGLILSEMWKTQVVDSPWNRRAWTLQEALVSPRIVYFAKERLFFECSTLDCLEGANISRASMSQRPNLDPQNEGNSVPINFLRQQDTLGFFHHNSESFRMDQMYRDYYIVIERYTARKLTFVEDRAAACSAIIEGITRITQSPVHHGLLMSDVR